MASGRMWLANKNFGAWVPCPSIEMPSGTQKWNTSGQFLNGGAYVRSSVTGARTYEMNWPMKHQAELDTVEAFFEGAYGPGPFYVVEPGSMTYNMFPTYMATPGMAADDGPSFLYDKRPSLTQLTSTTGELLRGAEYSVWSGDIANTFTLAIPAGHTLFTYVLANTSGMLATLNDDIPVDAFGGKSWDGGEDGSLIGFHLDVLATQTIAVYMMVAVAVPTGSGYGLSDFVDYVNTFPYPKGKGSTGMAVDGDFERTSYSAALDRYHGSVRLVEVEPWL